MYDNSYDVASEKQLQYARRMEELLGISMPAYKSRKAIGAFINQHLKEFQEAEAKERTEIAEQIKSQIRIVDYAQQLGFTLTKKGRYYSLMEHDSVRIDPDKNCFWRNSVPVYHGTGDRNLGGSVIDFAMEFTSLSRKEVIKQLAEEVQSSQAKIQRLAAVEQKKDEKEEINEELVLPKKSDTMRNVFAYLTKSRYIQQEVVQEMVDRKMLYQDTYRNCVFISYNQQNKPVFGCLRGTNTEKRFAGDLANGDYDHCFFVDNHAAGKTLVVAEAPIEVLSRMTIDRMKGIDYHGEIDYLGLAGTGKTQSVLHHFLQKKYDTVIIAPNNDKPGLATMENIKKLLKDQDVWIKEEIPPHEGADWNDELKFVLNHGFRPDYVLLNNDGKIQAVESRIEALGMEEGFEMDEQLHISGEQMLSQGLPNMDCYIKDYLETLRTEYPDKTIKEAISTEKSAGRNPAGKVVNQYNKKALKHRPEIKKAKQIQNNIAVEL